MSPCFVAEKSAYKKKLLDSCVLFHVRYKSRVIISELRKVWTIVINHQKRKITIKKRKEKKKPTLYT